MPGKLMPLSLLCAAATLCLAAPAAAQSASTIDRATLDAAVTTPRPDARGALRDAFASRPGRAAAHQLGLTSSQVADRIAALDDASAESLAGRLYAGGDRIVISATALIIILLVLILITD